MENNAIGVFGDIPKFRELLMEVVLEALGQAQSVKVNRNIPTLLSIAETCKLLRITRQTLNKMRKDKKLIPYQRKAKGRVLYKLEDVERLLPS